MNKLSSNITTITSAEQKYTRQQSNEKSKESIKGLKTDSIVPVQKAHIDLAAG
jgi:hypothetical protein